MNSTRWGLLGAGSMAALFAEALQSLPGAKIQAVAARTQAGADKFASQFGISTALGSFDQLIERADVDIVYISTPNEHHYDNCLKAIGAGKAVLCEKPFCLTAKEAKDVMHLARSRKVFCMEAMWMRFAPAVREAIAVAKDGKLGELQFFSGQLGFPYVSDKQNRLFRQPGGGALRDLGVYPLSLAQALFGSPVGVVSEATLDGDGVDEQFGAVLRYAGGKQAVIAASLNAKLGNAASIHGRGGVIQLDEPLYFPEGYRLTATAAHSTVRQVSGGLAKLRRYPILRSLADLRNKANTQSVSKRSSQSGYSFEASEVQRCLQSGLTESPQMSLDDTLAVMESMDSIKSQWGTK